MARSKKKTTLVEQLAAAQEAGDKERIDALMKEIAEALAPKPKPKPKPRKAAAAKPKAARSRRPPPEVAQVPPEPPELPRLVYPGGYGYQMPQAGTPQGPYGQPPYGPFGGVDASYMAPAFASGRGQRMGPDGRIKVEGRKVSMAGRQHINHFEDWLKTDGRGADELDRETAKAEKVIAKTKAQTPRPGMPGAKRPVAQKVQAWCGGCGRPYLVYPSEIFLLDSESEYKCDRCIRRGR